MSYLRSVYLHKDKSIFKLEEIFGKLPRQRKTFRGLEAAQCEASTEREEGAGIKSEQDGDSSEAGSDQEVMWRARREGSLIRYT